jgi:primosomal protein N' (replication factor Y)
VAEPVFARIAVNVPNVSGIFDYRLPNELAGQVGAGHLVTVPFGRQTVQGVVLELTAVPAVAETRPVLDLLDPQPVVTAAQIALARWMADYYLAPLAAMLGLMLPVGLAQQADVLYRLAGNRPPEAESEPASTVARRLLTLLAERGALRGRQIDRHFKNVDWRKSAEALARRGLLSRQSVLPPPTIRPKFVRTAQLAVPPAEAEAALPTLGKTAATQTRRQAALRFLMDEPQAVNVAWVYAASGCNLADLQELAERGLIALHESEIWRDPLEKIEKSGLDNALPPDLTADQQKAWEAIAEALASPSNPQPFLLHGVTGSGKTELYLRAAAEAARRGRQTLILVPEIAITPQMVRRFLARFPGQVGLIHSRLSDGERYDTWRRARLGLLQVVIGPRSALFAPLPRIGLIVLDECHDSSYYQSEPPFYHAETAARHYARLCGAVCILGSATPSVVQRYQAESGESLRLALPRRIVQPDLPPVQVVDMRQELKSGNRAIFSRALTGGLEEVLQRGQQAILFLNRRGTATYVFCRDCGYVARCPQCDAPLTLHVEAAERLTCHRCGYARQMLKKCPDCSGTQIRAYGLGSEKVESEVRTLFPAARTLRWDWETTRQKDAHEIILSHFAAGRADILIGTQMLAKGLDLPRVTLVGVVLAEVGLHLPDPFAAERTFNLLTQVAGRAGRSALGGRVILQTFQPEHYAIQAAATHDVNGFYTRELETRRSLGYPPFTRLVRLEFRALDAARAEAEARRTAEKIVRWLTEDARRQTTLIGPVPCFFAKTGGWHRWQIVLRGPDPASLLRGRELPGWRVEVDPISLL